MPETFRHCLLVAALSGAALAPADVTAADAAGIPGRKLPVEVNADRIEGTTDKEVSATGKAELRQGDVTIRADELKYLNESEEVTAKGNVRIDRNGDVITGPSLRYRMPSGTGVFEKPDYSIAPRQRKPAAMPGLSGEASPADARAEAQTDSISGGGARGSASMFEFLGEDRYRVKDATFTTCKPGNDDWYAKAGDLDLDYNRQVATARNATVYLLDKPILYLPWLSFSLNNERKSGVLPPTFGNSGKGGAEFTIPYYFNLAPNRDLTLAPRYMETRGLQLNGQFRYLERDYLGEVRFETLPNDKVTGTGRYAFNLSHNYAKNKVFGRLNIDKVSDDSYFRDLTSRINLTSQTNLNREGVLGYSDSWFNGGTYAAQVRVQQFQTLQDPILPVASPYGRAPQLSLSAVKQDFYGLDLNVAGEYVDFSHPSLVVARRSTMYPSLTYPVLAPWGFLTPKIGLHTTHYSLDRETPGTPSTATRIAPIYSLDTGLTFERAVRIGGSDVVQTLEPRAFYLRVPYRNQDQIPLFDTARADFNYAQIFSENSFVGGDRINDANQLTLAMTSRLLSSRNGQEAVRATVGQRFYFENEQVALSPADTKRTYKSSDWLAALSGPVAPKWTAETGIQYNSREQRTERLTVSARYKPADFKVLNLSYRYLRDQLGQFDVSTQWPLGSGWYAVGRYNFSLRDNRVVEVLGGLEYNGDCWVGRVVTQRFATAVGQSSNALFVQVELNGFSKIGFNPLETLKRNISGYSRLNQTQPSANQTTNFFD